MSGAFQISREIFNSDIWTDIPKFRIFFYIVGNAVFSEKGVQKGSVFIGRGQLLKSFRNIANDLTYIENNSEKKYSLSVIKNKVSELEREERITTLRTELGTLFTVVNYALYQGLENYKNGNLERGLERSENAARTEQERSENNNKNVKNVEEGKERINYKYIVEYLNALSDSNFKYTTKKTQDVIKARINEGFTEDDFKKVIAYCCNQWKGKDFGGGVMGDKYLRPSTLFNNKFDERLELANKKANGTLHAIDGGRNNGQSNGRNSTGNEQGAGASPKLDISKRQGV